MSTLPLIDDTWYQRPLVLRERISTGAVVARLENEQILIALVGEQDYPLYVLPKGGVEARETLEQTARREIEEAAGLNNLRLICKLGERERYSHDKVYWLTAHYFLFYTRQVEAVPTDVRHHYDV